MRFWMMEWTGFPGITEGVQNRQETRYRQESMSYSFISKLILNSWSLTWRWKYALSNFMEK